MNLGMKIFGLTSFDLALSELSCVDLVFRLLALTQLYGIVRLLVIKLFFGLFFTFHFLFLLMSSLSFN